VCRAAERASAVLPAPEAAVQPAAPTAPTRVYTKPTKGKVYPKPPSGKSISDTPHRAGGRPRAPEGRTKVLLSLAPDVVALLDEQAEDAGLSRSAYVARLVRTK
jgi:hypothetical protein